MGISGEVPTGLLVLQCYIPIFIVARITWLNGSTIAEAGTLPPEVLDLYGELLASKGCQDMPKPPYKIPAGVTPVPKTSTPVSNGGKTTIAAGGGSKAGKGQATAIR